MSAAPLVLATMTLLGWLAFAFDAWRGRRLVRFLEHVDPATIDRRALPSVSIVIAARNEERNLRQALQSVLALDYPGLEVVVVNDRSEDGTALILEELSRGVAETAQANDRSAPAARLAIEQVTELPDGWLGKNHALHRGAERATGDLLLFTDADVIFEPTSLLRAVACIQRDNLDHLPAGSDVRTPTAALELFVATFALFFNAYFRPWRMANEKTKQGIGIGAFNLVRRNAYERAGGHRAIAMRTDDDIRLGQALRDTGSRQAFAVAGQLVAVEWYPDLPAAMRGLEKNALAATNFSLVTLVGGAAAQLMLTTWPFVAIFLTHGPTQLVNIAVYILLTAIQLAFLSHLSVRSWTAFALPLGSLLVVFAMLRAAIITYWRGGVEWRGTFYELDKLR